MDRTRELVLLLVPAQVLYEPGQALVSLEGPTYPELYPWGVVRTSDISRLGLD